MRIEFTRECLLQAAKDVKSQFYWAWSNFLKSASQQESAGWQDLAVFNFRQHCELVRQAKAARSELLEFELIEEAAQKTA